jgi:hypothetical protein
MALTYVFLTSPAAVLTSADGQRTYTAGATGVATGVAPVDARLGLVPPAGFAAPRLLFATGLTADRPDTKPVPALTGQANSLMPAPAAGLPFYDTSLSAMIFFVGATQASTGWVNQAGTAV